MNPMEMLATVMLGGMCLPLGYLLAVTVASYRFRKPLAPDTPPLHLGVLIPAHNEATGIGPTIRKVSESDYPTDRLTVMVVADNCSDHTVAEARMAGAQVFERRDPAHPGKGQALDWFLSRCKDRYRHLDGIVIIDADVSIDRFCLREISASLNRPDIQVVQAYNGVSNARAGWRPALLDAAFNVFNHLRMAGAARLAGTVVLKGLGMGFRTQVLLRYGWPAHSIVEDQEFTLMLLGDGIRVHYNPDAVVRSEMVTGGDRAAGQRSRWEGGRFALVRRMAPTLFRRWLASRDSRFFFALCELALPPLSLLVLAAGLTTFTTLLWLPQWLWLAAMQWLILVGYVASGQIQRRAPLSTWLYLLAAPFFVLWKVPFYLTMIASRRPAHWSRTPREGTGVENHIP
jgi:cellulose synthase/poly-beta-1,6-N-acetylglucosamine synthase-like glycosyltransferase